MKKLVSILLCLVLVLGLLPMAAFADAAPVEVKVTPDNPEPKSGETVVFTVAIGAVSAMGSAQTYVVIPDGLTIVKAEKNAALDATFKENTVEVVEKTAYIVLGNGPKDGFTATGETTLFTITCTVDAGVHGEKTPTFMNEGSYKTNLGDNLAATIATTENAIPVNVPKTSYSPKTLTVTYAAPASLTITDKTSKPATAAPAVAGTDSDDTALPASVTGKATFAFEGTAPAGLAIDSKTGVVSVTDPAAVTAPSVTVKASLAKDSVVLVAKDATATINIVKATAIPTTVEITGSDTAVIPVEGKPANTYDYTAKVLDQYDGVQNVPLTWEVVAGETTVTLAAGQNGAQTLTVPATAKKGEIKITATVTDSNPVVKGEKSVTVTNISFDVKEGAIVAEDGVYGAKLSDLVKVDTSKLSATAGEKVEGTFTLVGAAPEVTADTVPNVGKVGYKVVFNSTDKAYVDVEVASGEVNVAKKPVTVTAEDVIVKVGSEIDPAEFTCTVEGLLGEDKLTGEAKYTANGKELNQISTEETGEYVIAVTGLTDESGNYDVKFVNGTLTVRKKSLKPPAIGQGTKPGEPVGGNQPKPDDQKPDDQKPEKVYTSDKKTDAEGNTEIVVKAEDGEVVADVKVPATIPAPETKFEDVPEGHWAEKSINNMAALGIVNGVGSNKYAMDAEVTRGTLATMLYRFANGKEGKTNPFTDVAGGEWFTDAIAWAADCGVVTGYSETTFGPNDTITREQLAVMLYRFAKLVGLDGKADDSALANFGDVNSVDNWAEEGMAWCVENGIINGVSADTLSPTTTATRAQTAAMLDRFVALMK